MAECSDTCSDKHNGFLPFYLLDRIQATQGSNKNFVKYTKNGFTEKPRSCPIEKYWRAAEIMFKLALHFARREPLNTNGRRSEELRHAAKYDL